MAAPLRVRAYNVLFGDALLVSVPDHDGQSETTRHLLVDFGNVLVGAGGDDGVFRAVFEDVERELDGAPLDLYVATHEHMDHVQGLPYLAHEHELELSVSHAWLTASAAEDYYQRFPEAERRKLEADAVWERIDRHLRLHGVDRGTLRNMALNNDPRRTADCVSYLRELADETHYVHRDFDAGAAHPFAEATLRLWAPEEDASEYYGRFVPFAADRVASGALVTAAAPPLPPRGVDATAFYRLVASRADGYVDNLLAIDRARNDTSVVLCLEWRGWKLLFAGDAEHRSWKEMRKRGVLEPVHFLKVAHHGSHNGTPSDDILDALMPDPSPDGWDRVALVSSCNDVYSSVPDGPTLSRLAERCAVESTVDVPPGEFIDVEFEG